VPTGLAAIYTIREVSSWLRMTDVSDDLPIRLYFLLIVFLIRFDLIAHRLVELIEDLQFKKLIVLC